MAVMRPGLCLLGAVCGLLVVAHGSRVLFVGNSFTFVNDLPHQLLHLAQALGQNLTVANSTIGGCTVFAQRPTVDARTRELLQQEWDFIVLQSYSALPTVRAAREAYLRPAVREFSEPRWRRKAKIVMYLTYGYHDGNTDACPSSDNTKCFPKGSLASMTQPNCAHSDHYAQIAGSFECMGYSLARGYLDARSAGADMVAPCGLGWQVVRAVTRIPTGCKAIIDGQYQQPLNLSLPISVPGGAVPGLMLYRKFGDSIDKHPNVAGQYLNACVFFATLFGKSPVGGPMPLNTGSTAAGDKLLTKLELLAIQKAAYGVAVGCGKACGIDMYV